MTHPNSDPRFNRRDFLRLALAAGGAAALSPLLKACSRAPLGTATPTVSVADLLNGLEGLPIDAFFEEAYKRLLLRDPEAVTIAGVSAIYGTGDDRLTDISDGYIRQTQALQAGLLALLRGYDRTTFSPDQILTTDVFDWMLDDAVRGHPFMYHDYPVTPLVNSVTYGLYQLFMEAQPLNNKKEAQDFITRLSQVGTKFEQLIDGLKRREAIGVILPRRLIPSVLDDLNGIAGRKARSNPFFLAFSEKIESLGDLNAEDKQALRDQAVTAINASVRPAYQALTSYFESVEPTAPEHVGVWQFVDGEAYYAYALRHHTTTEASAEAIHALGLSHVERIHAEMREAFGQLGYPAEESVPSLIGRLAADGGMVSSDQTVKAYEAAIARGEAMVDQAFDLKPRGEVIVVGGGQGDFYSPMPVDGSRPGIFYARTTLPLPRFTIPTTAFHETIPGHHFQIALARQLDQPSLRKGVDFNAFQEGWALYAERLMWELGAYADDPFGNLGRLQAEAFRAARLVVDTGLHAKRWTYEAAVRSLAEATGYPTEYTEREVQRYMAWPGQATSYYVGFLKLLELRQKAKDALGDRFDLKQFHRIVLGSGALPLTTLDMAVAAYITSKT